jgi:hypothetical protein
MTIHVSKANLLGKAVRENETKINAKTAGAQSWR